jgi:hypothetical protein
MKHVESRRDDRGPSFGILGIGFSELICGFHLSKRNGKMLPVIEVLD